MKKIIALAFFCAPTYLQAAYFEKEKVDFDEDGKPVITANLKLEPIQRFEHEKKLEIAPITINETSYPTNSIVYEQSHFVYPDESYMDAVSRWSRRDGIKNLAWSIDEDTQQELLKSPAGAISFSGSTLEVVSQLSRQLNVPLYMVTDNDLKMSAVHQWHGREVQITMVHGETLKETIKNLAEDYNWNWVNNPTAKSWLAKHDYTTSISYPIVTPKGDLRRALNLVIEGYPVSARLLSENNTLFIVDTQ